MTQPTIQLTGTNTGGTGLDVYTDHLYRHLRNLDVPVSLEEDPGREITIAGRPFGGYLTRMAHNLRKAPGADLVHALDPLTMHRGSDIVTLHDTYLFDHPHHYGRGAAIWRWWTRQARKCLAVICNSEYTASQALLHLDLDPDNVHVTHLAPRDELLYHQIICKYPQPTVLLVGSIKTTKNTHRMLTAINHAAHELDQLIRVLHAGPPLTPDTDRYHHLVDNIIQHADRIDWKDLGHVYPWTLNELYHRAHVLGFASTDEGFGLPVLEAMSVGTPVVASNHPVFTETTGGHAFQPDPHNVDELAEAFTMALTHPPPPADLQNAVAGFTWQRTAQQTLAVYQEVLERS